MMRKCHLNTCPVGIATQDPVLRQKFAGQPEHVINYLFMVAEEARQIMAELGFRTFNEMVGRVDCLETNDAIKHWKAEGIDLTPILTPAQKPHPDVEVYRTKEQDHGLKPALDNELIAAVPEGDQAPRAGGAPQADPQHQPHRRHDAQPRDRQAVGRRAAAGRHDPHQVHRLRGAELRRVPGQGRDAGAGRATPTTTSARGSPAGGWRSIRRQASLFKPEDNILIGNVALYGATSGQAFFRGRAAERFAVRNSGAHAVIEGVGDHGCEYMTGGRVVVLGPTGRNFAAGMSGGIAYVWDPAGDFISRCNLGIVELEQVETPDDLGGAVAPDRAAPAVHRLDGGREGARPVAGDHGPVREGDARRLQAGPRASAPSTTRKSRRACMEFRAMGKPTGFKEFPRQGGAVPRAARCGSRISARSSRSRRRSICACKGRGAWTAACRFARATTGCPIDNLIPEWNDLVYQGRWRDALDRLHKTNNFPEFTGRTCPAPCEGACVLGITDPPVTIKNIENAIIDRGFAEGWVVPQPPPTRTGKKVAIIGSGPVGPGCRGAAQQGRATRVTVYERADRIGGLLMYGIPNMKLDKGVVAAADRPARARKGSSSSPMPTWATANRRTSSIRRSCSTRTTRCCWRPGRRRPNDLPIPGRGLAGIHFAMQFLTANTKSLLDSGHKNGQFISAEGQGRDRHRRRRHRHRLHRHVDAPRLQEPGEFRAAAQAAEGAGPRQSLAAVAAGSIAPTTATRRWRPSSATTRGLLRDEQGVRRRRQRQRGRHPHRAGRVEQGRWPVEAQGAAGTDKFWPAQLVLLAMGFKGPEQYVSEMLGIECDPRTQLQGASTASSPPACPRSLPPATAAAASRSSSGPSTKAAARPGPSTSS